MKWLPALGLSKTWVLDSEANRDGLTTATPDGTGMSIEVANEKDRHCLRRPRIYGTAG